MTEQELFTRAFLALRERGFTRAWDDNAVRPGALLNVKGMCMYRSPIGPCAMGLFISDAEYDKRMEGRGICEVLTQYKVGALQGFRGSFLVELQEAHDTGKTPGLMERNLRWFASKLDLEVPE